MQQEKIISYGTYSLQVDSQTNKVNQQQQQELSYFEKMCKAIQESPFPSQEAQQQFSTPLKDWPAYHEKKTHQNSQERRSLLHKIPNLHTVELQDLKLILTSLPCQKIYCDAILNAANETLLGGGGIDEAIHKAAGPLLVRECSYLNGCQVGEAKITKGYDLLSHFVIHTVAPILLDNTTPDEKELEKCYQNSLACCSALSIKSGFPYDIACKIAIRVAKLAPQYGVDTVVFSVVDPAQQAFYLPAIKSLDSKN